MHNCLLAASLTTQSCTSPPLRLSSLRHAAQRRRPVGVLVGSPFIQARPPSEGTALGSESIGTLNRPGMPRQRIIWHRQASSITRP